MLIETCLVIIVSILIINVIFLLRFVSQLKAELRSLSVDTKELLKTTNTFIQYDLRTTFDKANHLIDSVDHISSDINDKSRSLNFIFQPLGFLNSKLEAFSSKNGKTSQYSTIPKLIRWIGSSFILVKTFKEVIKNHEKRAR